MAARQAALPAVARRDLQTRRPNKGGGIGQQICSRANDNLRDACSRCWLEIAVTVIAAPRSLVPLAL